MVDDIADTEHRLSQRIYELEMLTHKAIYHLAESVGLMADCLSDLSMDARTRIEIAQEAQDRVGVIMSALGVKSAKMAAEAFEKATAEIGWLTDNEPLVRGRDD